VRYLLIEDLDYYSLVQSPANRKYYVAWYDRTTKKTRQRSLRTKKLTAALAMINKIVRSGIRGDPKYIIDGGVSVDIRGVLADHEKAVAGTPNAAFTRVAVPIICRHVGDVAIETWSAADYKRLTDAFTKAGYATTYQDRILTELRSALNAALADEKISREIKIESVSTEEEREAAPLKGRLMTPVEVAQLVDKATHPHFLEFLIGELNSISRPVAMLEAEAEQIDWRARLIDMNPKGRVQNRKHRPILRIPRTWEPWLRLKRNGRLIQYRGKPVKSVKTATRTARAAAELKPDASGTRVNAYSIRHTIGRYLEDRNVPLIERRILLGHVRIKRKTVTDRYSPLNPRNPRYLAKATRAIEEFIRLVNRHTVKWDLLVPFREKKVQSKRRKASSRTSRPIHLSA
jgi:hypothetical protein